MDEWMDGLQQDEEKRGKKEQEEEGKGMNGCELGTAVLKDYVTHKAPVLFAV